MMLCLLLLIAGRLGAESLPVVELKPDPNRAAGLVVNNAAGELKALNLTTEGSNLRGWLEMTGTPQVVDVLRTGKVLQKLSLEMEVIGALKGASAYVCSLYLFPSGKGGTLAPIQPDVLARPLRQFW